MRHNTEDLDSNVHHHLHGGVQPPAPFKLEHCAIGCDCYLECDLPEKQNVADYTIVNLYGKAIMHGINKLKNAYNKK